MGQGQFMMKGRSMAQERCIGKCRAGAKVDARAGLSPLWKMLRILEIFRSINEQMKIINKQTNY